MNKYPLKYTVRISYRYAFPETGIGEREIDIEDSRNINYTMLNNIRDLELKDRIVTGIQVIENQ